VKYWLMKSEPEDFSLEDLRNRPKQLEPWTGVRNYQARNFMRDDMQVGDKVLFYHSSVVPPGIAGLAEIASEPFPDPTAFDSKSKYFDPRAGAQGTTWVAVNVKYVDTFPRLLPLEEMRRIPGLDSMLALQRGTRLSIQPVTPKEFKLVTEWIAKRPEAPAAPEEAKAPAAAPAPRKPAPAKGPKTKPLPTTRGKRVA
jgi:predicted RNA-binding protein with PUA-like domain